MIFQEKSSEYANEVNPHWNQLKPIETHWNQLVIGQIPIETNWSQLIPIETNRQ